MKKSASLLFVFPLAFIGDLGLSLLQVLSVLYGVILGASPLQTGLIGAAYGSTYVITAALFGRLGDKLPRKYSLMIATSCQVAISLYYLVIASNIAHLIFGQILLGCANGFFWPSIEAHISEHTSSTKKNHQKAISNFCLYWSIGFMIGPFLAGIFSELDVKIAFFIIFLFFIVGFSFVALFINSKRTKIEENHILESKESLSPQSDSKKNYNTFLVRILFGMFVYAMIGRLILIYYADYAKRPDGLGLFGPIIGLLLFAYGFGRTAYFIASRIIESKFNRINLSYLGIAFSLFSLIIITNIYLLLVMLLFLGIFSGLIYKSALELLLHSEKEAKGAKAGLFESAIGLGSSLSPLIAGLFAEISLVFPFFVFGVICIAIFLINCILELKK
ncbi:MAG: MFS transporter [Candidatus Lokiarchaeota archaeon]|nr:MFS transporter [Candidatus Lokiarchaeota archaeon]